MVKQEGYRAPNSNKHYPTGSSNEKHMDLLEQYDTGQCFDCQFGHKEWSILQLVIYKIRLHNCYKEVIKANSDSIQTSASSLTNFVPT